MVLRVLDEPVGLLIHDAAERGQLHGRPAQGDQVARGGVGRVLGRQRHSVEVGEARAPHAQLLRGGVHRLHEGLPAGSVGLGQGKRGVAAGRQQHGIQQLPDGQDVTGPQACAAGVGVPADVGGDRRSDLDMPAQAASPDHHQGGHDLGDAAHRPPPVQLAAPQPPAGAGVHQVGAPGLHVMRPAGRAGG